MEMVWLRKSKLSLITIAACTYVTYYGGSWLCLTFNNWRKMSRYMDHHAFAGLGLSHSVPKADFCVIVGTYTGQVNHDITAIISQVSLKAQIAKLFGEIAFIIILERILNI
jgi:hypothetical protein